jgi:hypothetical protein
MRLRLPLRVSAARHGEKEQSLRDFLRRHIGPTQNDAGAGPISNLQIVARSLDSPLIKAITTLGEDIAAAGHAVRLILAQLDRERSAQAWANSIPFAHELRWAKHPRLIEAHEQLVIGPEACWIGDCMRRDPAKCDAYESFIENCGEAAGCAAVSFERLWRASQAVLARGPRPGAFAAPAVTGHAESAPAILFPRH